jgi:hypothetical protein
LISGGGSFASIQRQHCWNHVEGGPCKVRLLLFPACTPDSKWSLSSRALALCGRKIPARRLRSGSNPGVPQVEVDGHGQVEGPAMRGVGPPGRVLIRVTPRPLPIMGDPGFWSVGLAPRPVWRISDAGRPDGFPDLGGPLNPPPVSVPGHRPQARRPDLTARRCRSGASQATLERARRESRSVPPGGSQGGGGVYPIFASGPSEIPEEFLEGFRLVRAPICGKGSCGFLCSGLSGQIPRRVRRGAKKSSRLRHHRVSSAVKLRRRSLPSAIAHPGKFRRIPLSSPDPALPREGAETPDPPLKTRPIRVRIR